MQSRTLSECLWLRWKGLPSQELRLAGCRVVGAGAAGTMVVSLGAAHHSDWERTVHCTARVWKPGILRSLVLEQGEGCGCA